MMTQILLVLIVIGCMCMAYDIHIIKKRISMLEKGEKND